MSGSEASDSNNGHTSITAYEERKKRGAVSVVETLTIRDGHTRGEGVWV